MSGAIARGERPSAVGEPSLDVVRLADMVCEATRQTALKAVTSTLSAAASRSPQLPDVIRDIADPILSRATIMQIEIDRFRAVAYRRPRAKVTHSFVRANAPDPANSSGRRGKAAIHFVATFVASEKERTKCHQSSHRAAST